MSKPQKLVPSDDPILRKRQKVREYDLAEILDIGGKLIATLDEHPSGVGLAAPQIGIEARIAVVRIRKNQDPLILVNPKIVEFDKSTFIAPEQCLSLPGVNVPIRRAIKVLIDSDYLHLRSFNGLTARVIQHELDHLDGILITDRAR